MFYGLKDIVWINESMYITWLLSCLDAIYLYCNLPSTFEQKLWRPLKICVELKFIFEVYYYWVKTLYWLIKGQVNVSILVTDIFILGQKISLIYNVINIFLVLNSSMNMSSFAVLPNTEIFFMLLLMDIIFFTCKFAFIILRLRPLRSLMHTF